MRLPRVKLPYTVAKKQSDYEAPDPDLGVGQYERYPRSGFTEGVFIYHRHFYKNGIELRLEFGSGLSYIAFNGTNLSFSRLYEGD